MVVIAVLAVIAAGVIAAINPGKRIRQANDAKIKNDIGQIATALEAYYTSSTPCCIYPTPLGALVTSGDLKINPDPPGAGGTYNYSRTATCTTTSCEAQVNYALEDPAVAGNVWCWRSATGKVEEVASCAP